MLLGREGLERERTGPDRVGVGVADRVFTVDQMWCDTIGVWFKM